MARQHTALKLILLLALLILLYLAITSDFASLISPATLPLVPQTVTHIVLFQFKSSVDNATIKKVRPGSTLSFSFYYYYYYYLHPIFKHNEINLTTKKKHRSTTECSPLNMSVFTPSARSLTSAP